MTDFPTLSYTSSSEIPYNPFVYLKPEEGTPFGWKLPIQVIIGSVENVRPKEGLRTEFKCQTVAFPGTKLLDNLVCVDAYVPVYM